ncbi:MAG: hypothetical protein HYV63_18745 [Candidatus Schekmanbacteria bacterium]|nr:hypothetical protein [Candidatus Schekmanbacteria bacterium]
MTDSCALDSLRDGELLAGTAGKEVRRWLFIQEQRPWGPKGFEDCRMADGVKESVAAAAGHLGARVQLIRRPARAAGGPARVVMAAYVGEQCGAIRTMAARDEVELADFDFAHLLGATMPAQGPDGTPSPVICFVCAHGRRDPCCARWGSRFYRAFSPTAGCEVWQTTHLGGHRFAANMLWMPHGVMLGRLRPGDATTVAAAVARGAIVSLEQYRGRVCYPAHVQAAEAAARRRTETMEAWAMTAEETTALGPESWRVRFRIDAPAPPRRVEVAVRAQTARFRLSCADPAPADTVIWVPEIL